MRIDRQTDIEIDTDRQMNGWVCGWMDGWMGSKWVNGWMGAPRASALGTPLFMGANLTLFLSQATRDGLQITEEQGEA